MLGFKSTESSFVKKGEIDYNNAIISNSQAVNQQNNIQSLQLRQNDQANNNEINLFSHNRNSSNLNLEASPPLEFKNNDNEIVQADPNSNYILKFNTGQDCDLVKLETRKSYEVRGPIQYSRRESGQKNYMEECEARQFERFSHLPRDDQFSYTRQALKVKTMQGDTINTNSLLTQTQIKIQKFKQNLKDKTSYYRKKMLTQHEFSLINDIVVFRPGESKYKKYVQKQVKSLARHIEDHANKSIIPILVPNHFILNVFDVFHFLFTCASLYYIPLEVFTQTYFETLYGNLWDFFIAFVFIIFIFNMIFTCNTGYYDAGEMVMERRKIITNYIKKGRQTNLLAYEIRQLNINKCVLGLFLDLMSLLPLIESIQKYGEDAPYIRLLNLCILFKVFTIMTIFRNFEEDYIMHQKRVGRAFLNLFRLILLILFVAHIFASCFLGLANTINKSDWSNETWITKYKPGLLNENNEWFNQYVYAFYWSTTTMTTVGYGDITPANVYEAGFATATILISCLIYAYTLNTIGTILRDLNELEKELDEKMRKLNRYMISKKISRSVQMETRRYLQHKYESKNIISPKEESKVLKDISDILRQKILIQAHMQLIDKCSMLRNNFSKEFLEQLALNSHSQNYIHDQPVFDDKFVEIEPFMYIIERGRVVIYADWSQEEEGMIQILKEGDYFGEMKFIFDSQRVAHAKSIGTTSLLMIGKTSFMNLLQEYPEDWERYCMLKDQVLNNKDYSRLELKCYMCKRRHLAQDCYKLNYVPDRERVILQYNFSNEHIRSLKYQRYDREKYNTYRQIYFTVKAREDILFDIMENEKQQHLEEDDYIDQTDFDEFETQKRFSQSNIFHQQQQQQKQQQYQQHHHFNDFRQVKTFTPYEASIEYQQKSPDLENINNNLASLINNNNNRLQMHKEYNQYYTMQTRVQGSKRILENQSSAANWQLKGGQQPSGQTPLTVSTFNNNNKAYIDKNNNNKNELPFSPFLKNKTNNNNQASHTIISQQSEQNQETTTKKQSRIDQKYESSEKKLGQFQSNLFDKQLESFSQVGSPQYSDSSFRKLKKLQSETIDENDDFFISKLKNLSQQQQNQQQQSQQQSNKITFSHEHQQGEGFGEGRGGGAGGGDLSSSEDEERDQCMMPSLPLQQQQQQQQQPPVKSQNQILNVENQDLKLNEDSYYNKNSNQVGQHRKNMSSCNHLEEEEKQISQQPYIIQYQQLLQIDENFDKTPLGKHKALQNKLYMFNSMNSSKQQQQQNTLSSLQSPNNQILKEYQQKHYRAYSSVGSTQKAFKSTTKHATSFHDLQVQRYKEIQEKRRFRNHSADGQSIMKLTNAKSWKKPSFIERQEQILLQVPQEEDSFTCNQDKHQQQQQQHKQMELSSKKNRNSNVIESNVLSYQSKKGKTLRDLDFSEQRDSVNNSDATNIINNNNNKKGVVSKPSHFYQEKHEFAGENVITISHDLDDLKFQRISRSRGKMSEENEIEDQKIENFIDKTQQQNVSTSCNQTPNTQQQISKQRSSPMSQQLLKKRSSLNPSEQQVYLQNMQQQLQKQEEEYHKQQEKQEQLYDGVAWLIQQQIQLLRNAAAASNSCNMLQIPNPPKGFKLLQNEQLHDINNNNASVATVGNNNPLVASFHKGSFVSNINKTCLQEKMQPTKYANRDGYKLSQAEKLSVIYSPYYQQPNVNFVYEGFPNQRPILLHSQNNNNGNFQQQMQQKQQQEQLQQQQQQQQQQEQQQQFVVNVNSDIPLQAQINKQVQKQMKKQTMVRKIGNFWQNKAKTNKNIKSPRNLPPPVPQKSQQQQQQQFNISNNTSIHMQSPLGRKMMSYQNIDSVLQSQQHITPQHLQVQPQQQQQQQQQPPKEFMRAKKKLNTVMVSNNNKSSENQLILPLHNVQQQQQQEQVKENQSSEFNQKQQQQQSTVEGIQNGVPATIAAAAAQAAIANNTSSAINNNTTNSYIKKKISMNEEGIDQEMRGDIIASFDIDAVVLQGYDFYFVSNNFKAVLNRFKFKPKALYRDRRYHLYAREIRRKQIPLISSRRKSRLHKQKQPICQEQIDHFNIQHDLQKLTYLHSIRHQSNEMDSNSDSEVCSPAPKMLQSPNNNHKQKMGLSRQSQKLNHFMNQSKNPQKQLLRKKQTDYM